MLGLLLKKIVGTRNDRVLKSIKPLVLRVNELEKKYSSLSDGDLRRCTAEFKERISKGEPLDAIQAEAFAVVREASKRTLGMRHFDVQLIGGAVLHRGCIAEMKTGEGKTLVATLAAYLNALKGKGVHVVTVNDYLARRDAEWMGNIYRFLDLSVGVVLPGMDERQKQEAYRADITYGQNNEFGFDYLRDNMKFSASAMLQRGHEFAIVDEVDSILIDEARTPLIISGPSEDATDLYIKINKIIPRLERGADFDVELKTKQPTLSEQGVAKCEELLGVENLFDPNNIDVLHHVNQALRAYTTMERDVDYVVKDGQIIIVDEFTGRLMPGRRWSNGLHQAIEAKEGVQVARENQTLASVTFQNLFRLYSKLSGMTGTADTEAVEFKKIYDLDVVVIPTNRPMIRKDLSDSIYRTRKEKYEAVAKDIQAIHATGQPILVGTVSIEQSETLSKILERLGVKHSVLNAKHHEREAEIVAQAGRLGAVMIATNMAGRGTDIVLGGNPEFLAAAEAKTRDHSDPKFQQALEKYREMCAAEKEKVIAAGGLCIIGTERHESRRIDNQLRGRAGRQGDPGTSRFNISMEDELMKRFGGERLQAIMSKMGWEEGMSVQGGLITRQVESAQRRVESFHFEARKHVTDYDNVMNRQRQVIYNLRNKILQNEGLRDEIFIMLDDLLEEAVVANCNEKQRPSQWNLAAIEERVSFLTNRPFKLPTDCPKETQAIFDALRSQVHKIYEDRMNALGLQLAELDKICNRPDSPFVVRIQGFEEKPFSVSTVEQDILLETLDHLWKNHLQEMDHLREGIELRGYGQKNPLHEYQREGFALFQQLLDLVKENVVRKLFFYQAPEPAQLIAHLEAEHKRREAAEQQMQMHHGSEAGGDGENSSNGNGARPARTPEDERARMEALRRERRRARR